MSSGSHHPSDEETSQPGRPENFNRFVNRAKERERLLGLIKAPAGSHLPILMFHGVAGQGKSWLLRELCQLAMPHVPAATLNFASLSSANLSAWLLLIRNRLKRAAPRFDLAQAVLEKMNARPQAKRGDWGGDVALVAGAAGADPAAVGGAIVKVATLLKNHVFAGPEAGAARKWRASEKGRAFARDLKRRAEADPDSIDSGYLLECLAKDLAEFLPRRENGACRAALFLDTFEELKVESLGDARQLDQRERWIFELWKACRETGPGGGRRPFLQIAIAGRDRVLWDRGEILPSLAGEIQKLDALEVALVGGLSRPDAVSLLGNAFIHPPALREAILNVSQDMAATGGGQPAAFHAFALGLCVDTVKEYQAANHGNYPEPDTFDLPPGKFDLLAARFLSSLSNNVLKRKLDRLAVTPRFDREALRAQFTGGDVDAAEDGLDRLLRYSFVEPLQREDEEGGDWYRLHPLMKEALEASASEQKAAEANQYWETYWAGRSEDEVDEAASLAWYHRWRREPAAGLEAWTALAESLRREVRMVDHAKVLEWWEPTGIERRKPRNVDEAAALVNLGIECRSSSLGSSSENIARAVAAYFNAMEVYTREQLPLEWAMVQNSLGLALKDQGIRAGGEKGRKLLEDAVGAYYAALEEFPRELVPQLWAMTQNSLGIALSEQGIRMGEKKGGNLLEKAVEAYRAALEEHTREQLPQQWATTQNNLGNVLSEQGTRTEGEAGKKLLEEAVEAYRAALEERIREQFPQQWATTQNNLGNAHQELGTRKTGRVGRKLLEKAVDACRAALMERTREQLPQQWATTQNNLGNALRELGTRSRGEAGRKLLEEAVEAYRAALEERTREQFPQQWATTQNNLGNALQKLGTRLGSEAGVKLLEETVKAYRTALEEFTREHLPQQWAVTQNNLGNALREWAGLDGKNAKSLLAEAIAAHQGALEVWTAEHFSHYHGIAMGNLIDDYALALGGVDRVREILETGGEEALRAALVEYFGGGDLGGGVIR